MQLQIKPQIITYYCKILNEKIEHQQQSSENLTVYATACFQKLCQIIDSFPGEQLCLNNQYDELEKQLIHQEAETRRHIQIEYQLKLYAESLEENNEELQYQLDKLNTEIIEISKENLKLKKKQSQHERQVTEVSNDRLLSIISQQQSHAGDMQKNYQQKSVLGIPKQSIDNSKLKIARTATIKRIHEISNIYVQQQKKFVKQRASSIHFKEQPCKSQHLRTKTYSVYD